jgi:hypothetical protein
MLDFEFNSETQQQGGQGDNPEIAKDRRREMSDTLCKVAKQESRWIWNELKLARANQSKLAEDSITDFLLLHFAKACDGTYAIRSFNRRQEAVSGADWELWFTGPSQKWLGLRVQAKVISLDSIRYPQLHYQRKGIHQLDTLVADAIKHSATPLYCLYSYWCGREADEVQWLCGSTRKNTRLFGASIVSVSTVRKLKARNDDSLARLALWLTPLHCLFCCQHFSQGGDLPTRAHDFVEAKGYGENVPPQLLDRPPEHVAALLGSLGTRDNQREANHLSDEEENLRTLTIIREID